MYHYYAKSQELKLSAKSATFYHLDTYVINVNIKDILKRPITSFSDEFSLQDAANQRFGSKHFVLFLH